MHDTHDKILDAYFGKMGENFMRETQQRIHWICSMTQGERVLDVGCSQGIAPVLLAREGASVLGIDSDSQAIEDANQFLNGESGIVRNRVEFICDDFATHDFKDALFDTVVMSEVLEHLVKPEKFVELAADRLKDGGCFVVTVPFGINDYIDHKRTYYAFEPIRLLWRYFTVSNVEIFGKWIGYACTKRKQPAENEFNEWPWPLVERVEHAFHVIERRQIDQISNGQRRLQETQKSLRETQESMRKMQESLHETQKDLSDARGKFKEMQESLAGYESDRRAATEKHASVLQKLNALKDELEASLSAERRRSEYLLSLSDSIHRENEQYRNSVALALGRALLAARTPRGLLSLPKAVVAAFNLYKHRTAGEIVETQAPIPPAFRTPNSTLLPVLQHEVSSSRTKPPTESELSAIGWRQNLAPGGVRILSIMDEFSRSCFSPHANLIEPRPDNWEQLTEQYRPDFAFVESSWKGNGGSWQYRVAAYDNPPGHELAALLVGCRERGIPTVFWNKEDPVHFDNFIGAAKDFDFIFTTAQEAVEKYEQTTSAQVRVLPFAAEPTLHNPIGSGGRKQAVCFAGSFYANRFKERQDDQLMLLDAASGYGLDIYDRNFGAAGINVKDFSFPERFSPFVRGRLSYEDMNRAYRGYRVFINVNSIVDSPTMFSRRVYELLACGTPVVSTWSEGIENTFGTDLVWQVRSREEAENAIRTLLNDAGEWRRRSLAGVRFVLGAHTYSHRFGDVLEALGMASSAPISQHRILVVGEAATQAEVESLVANFDRQSIADASLKLAIIGRASGLSKPDRQAIFAEDTQQPLADLVKNFVAETKATHLCIFDPSATYGRYFACDLLNASSYSNAEAVGKTADGVDAYAYGMQLDEASCLYDLNGLTKLGLGVEAIAKGGCQERIIAAGGRIFAADGANFIAHQTACDKPFSELLLKIEV